MNIYICPGVVPRALATRVVGRLAREQALPKSPKRTLCRPDARVHVSSIRAVAPVDDAAQICLTELTLSHSAMECLLACCLTYTHRGNSARSALAGQRAAAVAAARFALMLCQCSPTHCDCHRARPRSGLCCRLSTDLLLFAFVHAGCAHVSLASQTSQRLTTPT
jgi:hypothetical protein